ncbi:MAG TPA: glycosyltransferase family 2 protein [Chthoniobacterales bacterium]
MTTVLALMSALLAIVPAALFFRNLGFYRPLPNEPATGAACSVLIPVRNEEANIAAALRSVLQSEAIELELIVLDDSSTDRTAEIVRQLATADERVRLEQGQPLPDGWCGKPFACQQLAALARHSVLIFLDADVQMTQTDSLARLIEFVRQSDAALVSTIPWQETKTLAEKLIVPLIHFVLLGFLPIEQMRATTDPRFAAACGQVIAVRREAYKRSGGHAAVADRLHDAIALAREFRRHGYATDLFDGTDAFVCRMYHSVAEVWNGFSKNAHEGLGSARLLLPSTLLLLGGQVLPFALLFVAASRLTIALGAFGAIAALLPRLVGVIRFRQSRLGALLHPLGICLLVAIQWFAFARRLTGRGSAWKGRDYPVAENYRSARA